MDERVEKVWYTHDCADGVIESDLLTLDDLHVLNNYYVDHGHSEYSGRRRY